MTLWVNNDINGIMHCKLQWGDDKLPTSWTSGEICAKWELEIHDLERRKVFLL